jgi:phage repressor protein C with HTH and peptisase S24 domain
MDIQERIAFALNNCGKKPSALAKELGVSAARISQLSQAQGSIKAELLFPLSRATGYSANWLAEGVGDPHSDTPDVNDYALIKQHSAKGSAGSGYFNDHVEVKGSLVFKRDWLRRMSLREESLSVIYVQGRSMEPTLADGDVLLLDESQTEPLNGRIYAITRPDGELIIKRLIKTVTNGWVIRSDNEDKREYPDEIATDTEIGHLLIVGRVVWHGGAL